MIVHYELQKLFSVSYFRHCNGTSTCKFVATHIAREPPLTVLVVVIDYPEENIL